MTDSELLSKRIKDCGFTFIGVAKRMKLTRQGLWKKIHNRSEFKQSEIEMLSKLLELDSNMEKKIFFKSFVG